MANYPAPPSRRWAYDQESVDVRRWQSNVAGTTALSQAEVDKLNDEDDDYAELNPSSSVTNTNQAYLCFIFPQDRKLLDVMIAFDKIGETLTVDVEYSDDTTDGRDGAWTQQVGDIGHINDYDVRPEYRDNVVNIATAATHKAYRFKIAPDSTISAGALECKMCLLFGPEAGPADRLGFREVGSDTELAADEDFEDIARAPTAVKKTFRIKNLSGTKEARDIALTSQSGPGYGGSPAWTLLSLDDVVYTTSVTPPNLSAGALTSTIYLKSAPPVDAELGAHYGRVVATVGAWV